MAHFAPRSTQPSIPPGSVNEYQLWLGRQMQVYLIPLVVETQGVQVKLCYPLTIRALPEHLIDASCGGAIQIVYLYPLLLDLHPVNLGLTDAGTHMSDWQHQEVHSSQRCTKKSHFTCGKPISKCLRSGFYCS